MIQSCVCPSLRYAGALLVTPVLLFVWVGRLIELTGVRWLPFLAGIVGYSVALLPAFAQGTLAWLLAPNVRLSIPYGRHRRNELDVYLPVHIDLALRAGVAIEKLPSPRACVLFFPGGAWSVGFRGWAALFGMQLAYQGILAFCADYRNFPQADGYEATQDAQRALGWVQRNAWQFGWRGGPVWVAGQSAGAHILSLALIERAAREHRDRSRFNDTMRSSIAAGENTATRKGVQQQQLVEEGHYQTVSSTSNGRTASIGATRTTKYSSLRTSGNARAPGELSGADASSHSLSEQVLARRMGREHWSGAVFNRRTRVQTSMLGDLHDLHELHELGHTTGISTTAYNTSAPASASEAAGDRIASSSGATFREYSCLSGCLQLPSRGMRGLWSWVEWTRQVALFLGDLVRWLAALAVMMPYRLTVWTVTSAYVALQSVRGQDVLAEDLAWFGGTGSKDVALEGMPQGGDAMPPVPILEGEWQHVARWLTGIADYGMANKASVSDSIQSDRSGSKGNSSAHENEIGTAAQVTGPHPSHAASQEAAGPTLRLRPRPGRGGLLDVNKQHRGRWLDWATRPYPQGLDHYSPSLGSSLTGGLDQQSKGVDQQSKSAGSQSLVRSREHAREQGWEETGLHRVAGVFLMSGPYDMQAAAKQFIKRGMSVAMLLGIMGGQGNLKRMSPQHRLRMGVADGVLPVPRGPAPVPSGTPSLDDDASSHEHVSPVAQSQSPSGLHGSSASGRAAGATSGVSGGVLPPFYFLHGSVDRCVGPESSEGMCTALRQHGVPASCVVLEGVTHTDPILELPMEGFDLASDSMDMLIRTGSLDGIEASFEEWRGHRERGVSGLGAGWCSWLQYCGRSRNGQADQVLDDGGMTGKFDRAPDPARGDSSSAVLPAGWEGWMPGCLARLFCTTYLTPVYGRRMVHPVAVALGRWFNPF